jgi:pimeloyl-ACP methyl ester carboxylesterase
MAKLPSKTASGKREKGKKAGVPGKAAAQKRTALSQLPAINAPDRAVALPRTISGFAMSDAEVEQSLLNDDNKSLLRDYFGEAEYEELRSLAGAASRRSPRGDRILILPGIMGSKLGYEDPEDTLWFDPLDIMRGRLGELAMSAGKPIKPVGVILLAYLKLKLRLRFQGFDADFYPFDWRRSIAALGRELATFINASDRPVQIVAHSMGGLVSRASLPTVGQNLRRIIMLGTPNFGSLAPVQAFRGVGGTVGKLDSLDFQHDAAGLAKIFGEFPGLIEMIPARSTTTVDLFDLANWPVSGQRPAMAALQAARAVQDALPTAKPGVEIVMIAGCNQETVVDARPSSGSPNQPREFAYTLSREGDGTVPLKCALLPTADRTYYVEDSHGSLPGNDEIQRALPALLSSGATSDLKTSQPASRAATRTMLESDLERIIAASPTEMPGVEEQRKLLAEFVAPSTVEPAVSQEREALSDRLVIGHGGPHRIEITVAEGSITDAQAEIYVLGVFKNVEIGGAADAIDDIMGGALKNLMRRRMFGANLGEVSIIPAGRHPLRSNGVALVGLGPFDSFDVNALDIVGENLVRLFAASCIDDFAVVPIGAASSGQTLALFRKLMEGFLRGLKEADPEQRFRAITICEIDRDRCRGVQDELYRLAGTPLFADVEVTLRTKKLPRTIVERSVEEAVKAEPEPKVYLLVREESEQMGIPSGLTASLLTSGSMAAIHSGHRPFDPDGNDALGEHLRKLNEIGDMSPQQLVAYGEKLGQLTLADTVRTALGQFADHHLVVVHDALASRIPWEILRIGGRAPVLGKGISHRYEAANLAVAKWPGNRAKDQRLAMLLVVDPTENLAGARKEGQRIEAICAELGPAISLTVLRGAEARKAKLIELFGAGKFDLIHYAGHAFFDPLQRTRSGLICAGDEVLSGEDLATVGNLPSLMFFNACEAARVRGDENFAVTDRQAERSNNARNVVGFAEALLRGGVANLLGTYWPVGDDAASTFGEVFYRQLIGGATLDTAIHAARSKVAESMSPDWANYVFYGDPEFRMKDAVIAGSESVVEPRAVRVTVRYDPTSAELISCVPIQTRPPEARTDLDVGKRNAWIEVVDAEGEVMHRQPLRDPNAGMETTNKDGAFVRLERESQVETVSLDLPWPGAGASVIVHAKPAVQRGTQGRALARGGTERGRFDLAPKAFVQTRDPLPPVTTRPIWGHQNPNALTLAFFAEGFTVDEMDAFHAMVDHCVKAFENTKPFKDITRNLRVVEVATPSNVSGIAEGFAQDTAFRAKKQNAPLERVIVIDQDRAAKWLNQLFNTSALALVIVNTTDYGGSGGAATVFSCDPTWGTEICLHEMGHSLFDLADEYEAGGQPGDIIADEANVSTTADRAHLKWADLVKPETPLPTQRHGQASPGGTAVGAYEGARYQGTGVFRAQPDCKMRTPGQPYCAVCARTIERALVRHAP